MPSPLTAAIRRHTGQFSKLHNGPATVTSTSPLEVSISGGTTLPANRADTYTTPTIGDQVYVLYGDGDSVFIVAKIA
jgi:phage baseplate assembly protein gpV